MEKHSNKLEEAYEKLFEIAQERLDAQLQEIAEDVDDWEELREALFTEIMEELFESRDSFPWWSEEDEDCCE